MIEWLRGRGKDLGSQCLDPSSMGCGDMSCQASKEWVAANHRMHMGMAVNFTNETEVDFVRAMIPHHQGALEMCEILSRYGPANEPLEQLCHNITRVQRAEIMWMFQWLDAHGYTQSPPCGGGQSELSEPCEDLLVISEACHSSGGDRACSCSNFTAVHACGSMPAVQGRLLNVSEFCQRSCGLCSARPASKVGLAMRHNQDVAVAQLSNAITHGSKLTLVFHWLFMGSLSMVAEQLHHQ